MSERAEATWHGPLLVLRVLLGVAGAIALVPVVASLLLRHVDVEQAQLAAYVSATPVVVLAGVGAIALFALAWSRIGVAVAAVLTVLLALTQLPPFLGTASAADGSSRLVVMTLNMHWGDADAGAIVDAVREHDVDVLTLVEVTPDAVQELDALGIGDLLPHHLATPRYGVSGNGLWSRHPLTEVAVPPGLGHPPVAATVEVGGRDVFVAAVHPVAPYPDGARQWSREVLALADWLGTVDGPAVVAGDFNATSDHRQFRSILDAGFEDAAAQAGVGWQPTFPANRRRIPMLIAIDHVLAGEDVVATDLARLELPGTDHAALVATLAVAPGLAGGGG